MTTIPSSQTGPNPSSTTLQQSSSSARAPLQPSQQHAGLRTPSNRKTIYDRNLNRTRTAELSRASFAYLFSEMVTYAQRRVTGIQDLERRYVIPPTPTEGYMETVGRADGTHAREQAE